MLSKYTLDKRGAWDEFLDACVYAYNTAVHESTSDIARVYTIYEYLHENRIENR